MYALAAETELPKYIIKNAKTDPPKSIQGIFDGSRVAYLFLFWHSAQR